ncbi:hypothetical protein J2T22_001965 [Pseudarthrobacter defluvii]|uniref:Uncharacterized protein n=1 Tax=Pseudarthrobacter defluvii TaxID=410837 RepID=A0ABT9UKL3_9MICC|nr:hypothetical protein [Pseudarthrobacter defluvii]VXC28480.1 hypothetical protein ARTHRO8AJ_440231 [Arthrobacter sp. 8AJ]
MTVVIPGGARTYFARPGTLPSGSVPGTDPTLEN